MLYFASNYSDWAFLFCLVVVLLFVNLFEIGSPSIAHTSLEFATLSSTSQICRLTTMHYQAGSKIRIHLNGTFHCGPRSVKIKFK